VKTTGDLKIQMREQEDRLKTILINSILSGGEKNSFKPEKLEKILNGISNLWQNPQQLRNALFSLS
jgi:hypothetical protein